MSSLTSKEIIKLPLSKAQLLKFNSIEHGWRSTDGSVRHSRIKKHPYLYTLDAR